MAYTDLHTHGLMGRDSRMAEPGEYLRLAEAYMAQGTGAFLPTVFPGPVDRVRAQLAAIKKAMEMQSNPPLSPSAARILGAHIEGPFVNPEKAGALPPDWFLPATVDNLKRLMEGFETVARVITVAPELPGALSLIEDASRTGLRVNMGHSSATFAQAADGRRAGASGVTHLFNAMSPMHHREPGLAGYALMDDGLYVEVIADLVHVHPEMLQLVIKCKPASRVILVSDSLLEAKTDAVPPAGPLYMPGTKTLAGSGITLADAVGNLVSIGVPRGEAERFATE